MANRDGFRGINDPAGAKSAYVNQKGPQPNGGEGGAMPAAPTVFLADPDVTLYHGDVLETLRAMPDGSVDCVITSPPYWGLRDYGTGSWEGGDADCDHEAAKIKTRYDYSLASSPIQDGTRTGTDGGQYRDACPCGATRQDQQLGLEATPDLFVARMVEVFREVRRVLAAHGTCWVNLGDSYASTAPGTVVDAVKMSGKHVNQDVYRRAQTPAGLKPKDLVGIPWRVAFALQADGWYLRSDIIWAKPNPMPESVTDRPTKAHEYVFLLTKQPRYWFDQEAVREPHSWPVQPAHDWSARRANGEPVRRGIAPGTSTTTPGGVGSNPAGRNIRSVWPVATQPYPEAHFATYPEELVRRCLLAGCPEWVCRECGRPRERIVERTQRYDHTTTQPSHEASPYAPQDAGGIRNGIYVDTQTLGWSDCGHNNYRPGIVLDPFVGSGTTAHVARKHGRHAVGIDLNADYLALAAKRLQQQSLFVEGIA